MLKKLFITFLIFTNLGLYFATQLSASGSEKVTFVEDNSVFANPERGFHRFGCAENGLATVSSYRTNESITLLLCNFYLKSFINSPISQTVLNSLSNQLQTIRQAGLKVVLRFSYTDLESGNDASLTQIIEHIDQLTPILQANQDIIFIWHAGFIGAWGEWYYTKNFGNAGNISSDQWQQRKAVLDKMLAVLPNTFLSVRTPAIKRKLYGSGALQASESFNNSARSRIGHYNDAFVANANDYGTYQNKTEEYPYLAQETNFLPMGGENNDYNPPRSDCPTALSEMQLFHWTHINTSYLQETLNAWQNQGCKDIMKRNLGYRYVLKESTYSNDLRPADTFSLAFRVKNVGFASLLNARPVIVVLFNNINTFSFPLQVDPRSWQPNIESNVQEQFLLPSTIPAGTYKLALWLPDASVNLRSKPVYAIRFANTNIWDAALGYNVLSNSVRISTNGATPSSKSGDANGDNKVDGVDYVVWLNHYNQNVTGATSGDFNNSGKVDGVDYVIWLNNYGK